MIFDKKTIDAAGKKILDRIPKIVNPRCFIIIRAANVPAKQLQWISNREQVVVVVVYPLNAESMKSWIVSQLRKYSFSFEQAVPELIHQYTQGNMLACAQVIEKICFN